MIRTASPIRPEQPVDRTAGDRNQGIVLLQIIRIKYLLPNPFNANGSATPSPWHYWIVVEENSA